MKTLILSGDRGEPGGWPRNIGDNLLTDTLSAFLAENGHEVTVGEFGTVGRAQNRSPVSTPAALFAAIRANDCVLMGGGSLIQDDQPNSFFSGFPRFCAVISGLAAAARRPFGFVCVGAEHTDRTSARVALGRAVRAANFVLTRDLESKRVAESLGATRVTLAADAALLMYGSTPRNTIGLAEAGSEDSGSVVIALNRAEVGAVDLAVITRLAAMHRRIHLVSMDQSEAWDFKRLSGVRLPENVALLAPCQGTAEITALISEANLVIASRMHALYIAALVATPAVAVVGPTKVRTFAEAFSLPVVPLGDMDKAASVARLIAHDIVQSEAERGRAAVLSAIQGIRNV